MLYGCEARSLTLREEPRLRVFKNRILRLISEPKRDENGEWRKLHNEELHCLYLSPNILRVIRSRRLRWAGHIVRMEEGRNARRPSDEGHVLPVIVSNEVPFLQMRSVGSHSTSGREKEGIKERIGSDRRNRMNPVDPSFSLQRKSEESTKHYLTQMLLLTGRKKFTYAYEGSLSPHTSMLH